MITGTLRNDIDKLWEEFWTGGITNPLTVIEQISFLMYRGNGKHLFNNNIMRIRLRPVASTDYLNQYLHTRAGQRELDRRKSGTTSVFAIYYKQLATLPVLLPPVGLQQKYSSFVDQTLLSLDKVTCNLTVLSTLSASLTARAFAGRL